MAKARKDLKGRALWKGECQRVSDKRYVYTYTDIGGKRRSVYANDLTELRKKEQQLMWDRFDGIDSAKAHNITLNKMFECYIATKYDLRPNTFHTYKYLYEHYVGEVIGKKKLAELKYSDLLHFYFYLIEQKNSKYAVLNIFILFFIRCLSWLLRMRLSEKIRRRGLWHR